MSWAQTQLSFYLLSLVYSLKESLDLCSTTGANRSQIKIP
jgi:hypothetical protein